MLLRVSLVVLLDVLEVVKIIDHQAVRLLQRPLRRIGEEVEPFEPRAVAEMEARNRIERRATGTARVQIIPGGRSQQRLVNRLGSRLIPPPITMVDS